MKADRLVFVGARLVLAVTVVLALVACGQRTRQATTARRATTARPAADARIGHRLSFAYDLARPLGFVDRGVSERRGSISVHDVVFVAGSDKVEGYLVEPTASKRLPAVVLVHGSGGDRRQLLAHAITLARRGVVALTITQPSTSHPPPPPATLAQLLAENTSVTRRDVIAARRAADVLAARPTVDARRLGYLGWSAGAKTGTFVAASDARFRALALLSAGADTLSAFVHAAPKASRPLVRHELGSVDPLRYAALARPGTLLLEDATGDEVVPRKALENMIDAAPPKTVVRWYPAGHALNARAYDEAFTSLLQRLGVATH
jgi:dienelactone hydrolase